MAQTGGGGRYAVYAGSAALSAGGVQPGKYHERVFQGGRDGVHYLVETTRARSLAFEAW